jgi:uncharacterized protein YkwD
MVPNVLAPRRRRLASLVLVALLGAAVVAPGAAVAAESLDPAGISTLETQMVAALNADRTAVGLVPVRVDARLMAIARARSADMVEKDYFSHSQPDGRNVFNILSSSGITWYNAGEIIAYNNYPLDSTVAAANNGWMNSPGHHAIVVSADYNYVGVGLAIDPATGLKLWTAVYIKGPDRTAARASAGTAKLGTWLQSNKRRASVTWSGYDPQLQVLTAGLKSFAVQVRTDGGAWRWVTTSTTSRSWAFNAWKGHRYEVRVSPLDRAGNRGAWITQTVSFR